MKDAKDFDDIEDNESEIPKEVKEQLDEIIGRAIWDMHQAKLELGKDATEEEVIKRWREITIDGILDKIGNNPKKDWVDAME